MQYIYHIYCVYDNMILYKMYSYILASLVAQW